MRIHPADQKVGLYGQTLVVFLFFFLSSFLFILFRPLLQHDDRTTVAFKKRWPPAFFCLENWSTPLRSPPLSSALKKNPGTLRSAVFLPFQLLATQTKLKPNSFHIKWRTRIVCRVACFTNWCWCVIWWRLQFLWRSRRFVYQMTSRCKIRYIRCDVTSIQ